MAEEIIQTVDERGAKFALTGRWYTHRVFTWACTTATNGSLTATAMDNDSLSQLRGLYVHRCIVEPGTPNPTANSDLTITDEWDYDILNALGTDALDATGNATLAVYCGTFLSPYPLCGPLTLTVTGNSVDSAQFAIHLILTELPALVVPAS